MDMSERTAPNRLPLPPLFTAAAVLAALALQWLVPIGWEGSGVWRVLGALLVAGAVAAMGWAVTTMVRAQANVLPHRAATGLVTHGPFAWSRNPIYAADVALVAGLGLLFGNAWMLGAAPVLALLLRELAVKREERHMAAAFGGDWQLYAGRVRRWL